MKKRCPGSKIPNMKKQNIKVEIVSWNQCSRELIELRNKVFVQEQNVPPEHEQDGRDPEMVHIGLHLGGRLAGCALMDEKGHVGRVAVDREFRGLGLGTILMQGLEKEAVRRGLKELKLNAQKGASGFYIKLGYSNSSKDFL